MQNWEFGKCIGFTVGSKAEAERAFAEGIQRHKEEFGIHANIIRVAGMFPWPEVLGRYKRIDAKMGHERLMLFCYEAESDEKRELEVVVGVGSGTDSCGGSDSAPAVYTQIDLF